MFQVNNRIQPISCFHLISILFEEVPLYELEGDGYSKKVIVNSIARFRLRTHGYSRSLLDQFSLSIVDPHGHPIVVQRRTLSSDLLELTYQPMSIGEHQLSISFDNKLHRQIVLNIVQDETNYLSKFKPFGPGLQRAIVGLPTEFYVDLNQQTTFNQHPIQFSLEPSYEAEVDYEQQMAIVRYIPLKQGDCPIHILESDKDISQSPFLAQIKEEIITPDPPRIRIHGLTEEIIVHRPIEFQVVVENPFSDPMHSVHIEILSDEISPTVSIRREDPSTYHCSFIPTKLGRHVISIDYAGLVPENNPFTCQGIQEKDIQLTGPAINTQCLTLNEPTHFYFTMNDFLTKPKSERNSTYESGYSSNEETSVNSASDTDRTMKMIEEENNYRVTITDGHGNIKPNISIQNPTDQQNDHVRVDFTPDEQILFINISCTW